MADLRGPWIFELVVRGDYGTVTLKFICKSAWMHAQRVMTGQGLTIVDITQQKIHDGDEAKLVELANDLMTNPDGEEI